MALHARLPDPEPPQSPMGDIVVPDYLERQVAAMVNGEGPIHVILRTYGDGREVYLKTSGEEIDKSRVLDKETIHEDEDVDDVRRRLSQRWSRRV